jgi:hypothetical protein
LRKEYANISVIAVQNCKTEEKIKEINKKKMSRRS